MSDPPAYWTLACRELRTRDRTLASIMARHEGHLTSRGRAFETLSRSIIGQQISVHAAQAVWRRLVARCGRITPARIAGLSPAELRACGLSVNKARFLHELAHGFVSGQIRPRRWRAMDDEAIIAELTSLPGIGRWTSEMFLIFHLLRPDVFPLDDLGLRRGIHRHYGLDRDLDRRALWEIGERWRPWRTVATWYLWRSLDPTPVAY